MSFRKKEVLHLHRILGVDMSFRKKEVLHLHRILGVALLFRKKEVLHLHRILGVALLFRKRVILLCRILPRMVSWFLTYEVMMVVMLSLWAGGGLRRSITVRLRRNNTIRLLHDSLTQKKDLSILLPSLPFLLFLLFLILFLFLSPLLHLIEFLPFLKQYPSTQRLNCLPSA